MKILKKKYFYFFLIAVSGINSISHAQAEPKASDTISLDKNPYIELYRLRVTQAELNFQRQQALSDLAQAKLARARKIVSAMSAEELDVLASEASVTTADLKLADKKIEEANTYLRLVEALVKRGVSIPLCTYGME